jgi:glycosyltransferase involved in cell wall biosynthesis
MNVEPEIVERVDDAKGKIGPLVSIVIPCYNSSRTLGEAIDSALGQIHPCVEVIVVDDGSTDNTAQVCAGYGNRIRLVSQPNTGLSAARNAGVQVAQGEYVTLLDADDLLLPECVSRRLAILEANPDIGLVAGWFREIERDGKPVDRIPELRKVWVEQPFRQAVRRNWGPPVGWTFRRQAFRRVGGFDPFLRSCEDWDFVIRVAARYAIGYDPTPQVLYRKGSGQMSSHHEVMLDAAERVHWKNRAYTNNPLAYWLDVQYGRFELGRRTLYTIIFEQRLNRASTILKLSLHHPYLLWVLILSAVSYLFGKRASAGRGIQVTCQS